MARRLYTFGFIVLIGLLMTQPCQDEFESSGLGSASAHTISITSSSENETETEDCSPFCICQCCGMWIAYDDQDRIEAARPLTVTKIALDPMYKSLFTDRHSDSIWQPPKV